MTKMHRSVVISLALLTTVDQSVSMLGSISARLLLERIDGRAP